VLLKVPRTRVEEVEDGDPERKPALTSLTPPARNQFVAARQNSRPAVTEEVSKKDNKGALNSDGGGFKLGWWIRVSIKPRQEISARA